MMLVLSSRFGALAQRIGPRVPMTVGPLIVAAGLAWFSRVGPGARYLTNVFPAAVVFGLRLAVTVAPLTAAVLKGHGATSSAGVGSAINNAVARLAGLLAVAVLPTIVGLDLAATPLVFTDGYSRAMLVTAGLAVAGALASVTTISSNKTRVFEQPLPAASVFIRMPRGWKNISTGDSN